MKCARLWLLCALLPLAGCHHKVHPAAVPALPAPEPPPVAVSVPPPTHPTEPMPQPEAPAQPAPPATVPAPRQPRRHRSAPPAAATPAPASSTAAAAPVPAPSPAPAPAGAISLGSLTTGNESGGQLQQESSDLIRSQQQRLASLPSELQSRFHTQLQQVALFLRQAQDSWHASDFEGARTLATKAKVLLDEIQK